MDIPEWKKKRVEIMKLPPLERIKKLQEIIKTVKHPLIIDDIISLLHRTAMELDVKQQQRGGTFFQPSRLELMEREPERTIERKVETVFIRRRDEDEDNVKKNGDKHGYETKGYEASSYFGKAEESYQKEEAKEFESTERKEGFLREEFDSNIRKYHKKKPEEDKEGY